MWAIPAGLNSMNGMEGKPEGRKRGKVSKSSRVNTALNTSFNISAQWLSSILSSSLFKKKMFETGEGFKSFQNLVVTFQNRRMGLVIECVLSIMCSGFICPRRCAICFPCDIAQGLACFPKLLFLFFSRYKVGLNQGASRFDLMRQVGICGLISWCMVSLKTSQLSWMSRVGKPTS